jgi:hypothetical protein
LFNFCWYLIHFKLMYADVNEVERLGICIDLLQAYNWSISEYLIFYLFQIKCFEWNHKPVIYSDISTNSLSCLTGVYPAIHPMTGLQFYTCGKIEWWVLVLYFAFVPMFHDLFDVYIKSILFNIRDQSVLVQDIWICVLPVPVRLQHILHLLASFWPWGVYWII